MSGVASHAQYLSYEDLTAVLRHLTEAYPDLAQLDSCGQSLAGREIWVVTVTNGATGAPEAKPAIYIDANIHAGEPAGSAACLYTLQHLLSGHGSDPQATHLLDHFTFYIVPRVNPDGTEVYLTTPQDSWGSLREYPNPAGWSGLDRCDVDGDGEILLMRVADPNGEWMVSPIDDRLLVARPPHLYGGRYYRVYPEGVLIGEASPADFAVLPRRYQENLNRNFPLGWDLELKQPGGGAYPLSEPEARAVASWVLAHPNIGAVWAYHTYGGVYIRGYADKADEYFPPADLAAHGALAAIAERLTGYKTTSDYHGFLPDKRFPRLGTFTDWTYEQLGIFSLTAEMWSAAREAGVQPYETNFYPRQHHPESDELLLLQWNDRVLAGEGFRRWAPFDHPQLGLVEIGGWRIKYTQKNPPPTLLAYECEKHHQVCLAMAGMLPHLVIRQVLTTARDGLIEVAATVENAGFLPTYLTEAAKQIGIAKPVQATITLPQGWRLVSGEASQSVGHLAGRLLQNSNLYFGQPEEEVPRKSATARWLIALDEPAATGTTIRFTAEKAGTAVHALVDKPIV